MNLFDSKDILKLFNKYDRELYKLCERLEYCCDKTPVNIGDGIGIYKECYKGDWRFKSLIAGNNVTIIDNGNDITISSTGGSGSFNCTDLLSCSTSNLPEGSNLYFTDERAQDAVGTILANSAQIAFTYNDLTPSISASFVSNNISQFTNDSGYITSSGAALTDNQVGFGSPTNTLTGSSNFTYNETTQEFLVGFGGVPYLVLDSTNFHYQLGGISAGLNTSLDIDAVAQTIEGYLVGELVLSLDKLSAFYSIGANGFDNGTHILIDDTGNRLINLNSTNGVVISQLATGGTEMVVADATGLLSKQAIPSGGFISSVTDTATIDLDVTLGVLTANFINAAGYITASSADNLTNKTGNISQWTNDAGYLTTTGITPAALTKVDDTNVTLTLGGTPSTALLQATSLTLGWTGVLSYTRGGSDGWVDYSATSTVVGWSSFTTKEISYTRVGTNTLTVRFVLTGTSNSTSATFTLPVTSVGGHILLIRATDNSLAATAGFVTCGTSNTVTAFSTVAAPAWTAANIKSIAGVLTIQY